MPLQTPRTTQNREDLEAFADQVIEGVRAHPENYPHIIRVERTPCGLTYHALQDGVRRQVAVTWGELEKERGRLFSAFLPKDPTRA